MPNTAVKLTNAESTRMEASREDRKPLIEEQERSTCIDMRVFFFCSSFSPARWREGGICDAVCVSFDAKCGKSGFDFLCLYGPLRSLNRLFSAICFFVRRGAVSSRTGAKKSQKEGPAARMLRPAADMSRSLSSAQLASLRQALRTTPPRHPLCPSGDGFRKRAGVIHTGCQTTQACLWCGRGSASLMPLRLCLGIWKRHGPFPCCAGPSPRGRLYFGKKLLHFIQLYRTSAIEFRC